MSEAKAINDLLKMGDDVSQLHYKLCFLYSILAEAGINKHFDLDRRSLKGLYYILEDASEVTGELNKKYDAIWAERIEKI